jgi:BlaI family penicillinase repressor
VPRKGGHDAADKGEPHVARPRTGRPTDGELEILNVLWERGPCTAGQVREAIAHIRPVGYNTIQKALQIMLDKRLVSADTSERAHVFRAREPRSIVVSRMVADLVRRALGGSTSQLLLHALEGRRATREELEEMRRVLDEAEQSQSSDNAGKG